MSKVTRVGVDLAKNVIQVHAVDAAGKVVTSRALKRERFLHWCAELPEGCLVVVQDQDVQSVPRFEQFGLRQPLGNRHQEKHLRHLTTWEVPVVQQSLFS